MLRRDADYRGILIAVMVFTTTGWGAAAEMPQRGSRRKSDHARTAATARRVAGTSSRASGAVTTDRGESAEIHALKQLLAAQQAQIEQLRVALEEQRELIEQALKSGGLATASARSLGDVASANPILPSMSETLTPSVGSPAFPLTATPQDAGPRDAAQTDPDSVKGELRTVAEAAQQTNQRVAKLESSLNEVEKRNAARVKGLGNFNFSGDVRLRYEPFFQEGNPTRQRERIRARLNITGKVSDEVSGGLSVASGTLDDVNSSNQTLTGFFTRKTIGFDKYYLTYKPKWFKPLGLTAGKMVYPWYRTPLTFDNDLSPEGFSQTLSFDLKNPTLKNITLVGFQLPFNEVSSSYDSFILGGQLQARFKISDRTSFALYASGVNFNRADPIAIAVAGGTLRPSLANANTFRTNAAGDVIGYASKFAYLDLISVVDYRWSARWPMTLTFNFVNNTRAASQERSAYMADITFGQLREAKDVQFGYSYWWIEKDAVIGAFNESDLRSSTNVKNHRLLLGYQGFNNVTLQWTTWLGKLDDPFLNTGLVPSGIRSNCTAAPFTNCRDSLLNRMQLDFTYRF